MANASGSRDTVYATCVWASRRAGQSYRSSVLVFCKMNATRYDISNLSVEIYVRDKSRTSVPNGVAVIGYRERGTLRRVGGGCCIQATGPPVQVEHS